MRQAFQPRPESAEYTAWRQQFLLYRLRLGLRIATPIGLILVVSNYAIIFSDIDKFDRDILKLFEDAGLGLRMRLLSRQIWVPFSRSFLYPGACSTVGGADGIQRRSSFVCPPF
jgi:hypothetical protein